ncbi:MAG TPA: hypothetical protein VH092_08115, partial [Urbifossiella sp.]|nr:hypothetical protein [Urbifossiella sp.]
TLYSLDPEGRPDPAEKRDPAREVFHNTRVHGKTVVKDAAARKALFDAFRTGVQDHNGSAAKCFAPRHGLRIKSGEATVDLLICFECFQVQVFENDKAARGKLLVSRSPRGAFNKALTDAGVPLDKGAE